METCQNWDKKWSAVALVETTQWGGASDDDRKGEKTVDDRKRAIFAGEVPKGTACAELQRWPGQSASEGRAQKKVPQRGQSWTGWNVGVRLHGHVFYCVCSRLQVGTESGFW